MVDLSPAADADASVPDWVRRHWDAWERKAGLRRYYESEFFARIVAAMPQGRSLEVGAGPGFFARHHRCDTVTDVTPAPHIDRCVDVHNMPFEDDSFSCVVGIDVIHHLQMPATAFAEMARVLVPGGRLVLIEPWTGPVGTIVNTYLHDEDCFAIAEPWGPVFRGEKDPMDGNATIPRTYFEKYADELPARVGLRTVEVTPFACLGYLATGGFTALHLPDAAVRLMQAIDHALLDRTGRFFGLKVLIVAEKPPL